MKKSTQSMHCNEWRRSMNRVFQHLAVFVVLACTAASCGPRHSTRSRPPCAFADPELMSSIGICHFVAEYYVAHREWPLTKAQLEEQYRLLLKKEKAAMSAEEFQDMSAFFDQFTLLNFRKSGENLVFHYRFIIEGNTTDQTVTLRPRTTANEILQAMTAKSHD